MIPPAFALGSVVLDCLLVTTILRFGLLAGATTAIGTDVMLVVALLLILGSALRDAPAISFSKLQREPAANADLLPAEFVVTEADLLGYRESQTRRTERRPRAPKVPR